MADLDDLGYKSITEMTTDEALEMLRQIRLSRRTPVKTTRTTTAKKKTQVIVSANDAAKLLSILTGETNDNSSGQSGDD